MAKTANSSRKIRPALTAEAREKQLIDLAYSAAEKQLMDGIASSQVITHFLKLSSEKTELEIEKLRNENEQIKAKTEAIKSEKKIEEMYGEAISAMKRYAGQEEEIYDEY